MPHICTRCNSVFESGEDILKGCPSCGWKKFMFVRKMPPGGDISSVSQDRIISRAMGVRMPPKKREKPLAIDRDEPSIREFGDGEKLEGEKLESIKITAPGTYELNLPSLFEREELIMAVKEGTYFIDLTSVFRKSKKD
ncbi:MAG TPA: Zn-ribbon domain-containing protein [Methanothrix soehngenii]|uniref:Zn-ribbon domain-containing protein n=1 Tax=Methanothrix TaxID=2222 RepID=UPI001B6D65B5|nr:MULTISPECIES: Zn-ribbon domain-containing protein [Methanothrix]MBP7069175.1 Zn-ribbon domain-containing protein [Methanothrix sp.]HOI20860.1 Zn-ribbon domain-containing protein [Methanothrix soehngenii]